MDGSVVWMESWRKGRQNSYRPPVDASEYVIRDGTDTLMRRAGSIGGLGQRSRTARSAAGPLDTEIMTR